MIIFQDLAHARAVAFLQALLSKLPLGSSSFCIAERALDLAFNGLSHEVAIDEQELIAQAQVLIGRQVRANLLVELPRDEPTETSPFAYKVRSTRCLTQRKPLLFCVADPLAQAGLWLNSKAPSEGGHGCIR